MTYLAYTNFYFFTLPTITLIYVWFFFFKTNNNTLKLGQFDKTTQINIIPSHNNCVVYTKLHVYVTFLHIVNFFFLRGKNSVLWFEHLVLTNFLINIIMVFFCVSLLLAFLLCNLVKKNTHIKGVDYLFSLINLTILLPYIFFSGTVFTFLFVVEILSSILLYKLISSRM